MCLEKSQKVLLLGYSSHITILHMVDWWYHLIPNIFLRLHWSRASILSTSLLVTAQHSDSYRNIDRMQELYSFSLVEMEPQLHSSSYTSSSRTPEAEYAASWSWGGETTIGETTFLWSGREDKRHQREMHWLSTGNVKTITKKYTISCCAKNSKIFWLRVLT